MPLYSPGVNIVTGSDIVNVDTLDFKGRVDVSQSANTAIVTIGGTDLATTYPLDPGWDTDNTGTTAYMKNQGNFPFWDGTTWYFDAARTIPYKSDTNWTKNSANFVTTEQWIMYNGSGDPKFAFWDDIKYQNNVIETERTRSLGIAPIAITPIPLMSTVLPTHSISFSVLASGSSSYLNPWLDVTWNLSGSGTITADGLYTAPLTTGTSYISASVSLPNLQIGPTGTVITIDPILTSNTYPSLLHMFVAGRQLYDFGYPTLSASGAVPVLPSSWVSNAGAISALGPGAVQMSYSFEPSGQPIPDTIIGSTAISSGPWFTAGTSKTALTLNPPWVQYSDISTAYTFIGTWPTSGSAVYDSARVHGPGFGNTFGSLFYFGPGPNPSIADVLVGWGVDIRPDGSAVLWTNRQDVVTAAITSSANISRLGKPFVISVGFGYKFGYTGTYTEVSMKVNSDTYISTTIPDYDMSNSRPLWATNVGAYPGSMYEFWIGGAGYASSVSDANFTSIYLEAKSRIPTIP